ncbi:MAG TPA: hypothetical protein VGK22_02200 [Candidatus Angelobacter sp.]|jgi:hypothetical protein
MTRINQQKRRFWVVSPNVRYDYNTVGLWRQASVTHKAVFMGYHPNDKGHKQIGYKFAHVICPNDIVLIARRHHKNPQVVGYGVVVGPFKRKLTGFKPPEPFGSLRTLSPFKALSGAPKKLKKLNIVRALGQIAALHELHPARRQSDRKLCDWMERQLKAGKSLRTTSGDESRYSSTASVRLANLPHYNELEFQMRTKRAVLLGKQREAALLGDYQKWLLEQGYELQIAKYKRLVCDAYEEERRNLIEAKCSASREYIRMAAGQLLDYAYLGRKFLVTPNKAILLPERPKPESIEWLVGLKISVVWKEGNVFLDNANGQFS